MPFINSKITLKITNEQETQLKEKLGAAIAIIPGKSESWLMLGFEDDYCLYFRGEKCEKAAFVDVKIYGKASSSAYNSMTNEICNIYNEILDIPSDQIYVTYQEISEWGFSGHNF